MINFMTKKKNNKLDLIDNSFLGEYIRLILEPVTRLSHAKGDEMIDSETNIAIDGYLLEKDDNYFYLGSTAGSVTQAIRRDLVMIIQTELDKDEYSEYLDKLETPKKGEFN